MTQPDHLIDVRVSFGHCDPSGVVHYPNYLRWFDRCFHDLLHVRGGGHASLCARLGAVGLGLMEAGASVRGPVRQNQTLRLELRFDRWSARSLRVAYAGFAGGRLAVEGHETRGVFVSSGGRMQASAVAPLRAALES